MKHFILSTFMFSVFGAAIGSTRSTEPESLTIGRRSSKNLSTELNRSAFYKAMKENNKELVNSQIDQLKSVPFDIRGAFLGTMIMKKAGLIGIPAIKLHLFREGHQMLEAAIRHDPDNAEYRFLPLMIQEHAPGILGYKNDVEKDSEYISKSYKSLPEEVQHAIADYS